MEKAGVTRRADLYKTRCTFVTHGLANGENLGWAAQMLGRTTLLMRMTRYYRSNPNLTRQDGTLLAKQLGRQRRTGR